MQDIDIYEPWVGALGLNNDIYRVFPAVWRSLCTGNEMILNVGMRFDYWAPGQYVDNAIKDTNVITIPNEIRQLGMNSTYSFFRTSLEKEESARGWVLHIRDIGRSNALFLARVSFRKRPKPRFVYAKLNPSSGQSSSRDWVIPILNPETTVAYELGFRHNFRITTSCL